MSFGSLLSPIFLNLLRTSDAFQCKGRKGFEGFKKVRVRKVKNERINE
jgi:hypothetical protein